MPPLPDTHPARWDAAVRHAREVRERTDDLRTIQRITVLLRRYSIGIRNVGLLRLLENLR